MSRLSWALLLLIPLAGGAAAKARKALAHRPMENEGSYSKVTQPGHEVVQTPEQWRALWDKLGKAAPSADLSKNFAVAVFAGTRNSGGYGIVFDAPVKEQDALVVRYKVTKPKGMATMALTQPYAVRLFPRQSGLPVRVEGRDE